MTRPGQLNVSQCSGPLAANPGGALTIQHCSDSVQALSGQPERRGTAGSGRERQGAVGPTAPATCCPHPVQIRVRKRMLGILQTLRKPCAFLFSVRKSRKSTEQQNLVEQNRVFCILLNKSLCFVEQKHYDQQNLVEQKPEQIILLNKNRSC